VVDGFREPERDDVLREIGFQPGAADSRHLGQVLAMKVRLGQEQRGRQQAQGSVKLHELSISVFTARRPDFVVTDLL
jgi:hypothetical protein